MRSNCFCVVGFLSIPCSGCHTVCLPRRSAMLSTVSPPTQAMGEFLSVPLTGGDGTVTKKEDKRTSIFLFWRLESQKLLFASPPLDPKSVFGCHGVSIILSKTNPMPSCQPRTDTGGSNHGHWLVQPLMTDIVSS